MSKPPFVSLSGLFGEAGAQFDKEFLRQNFSAAAAIAADFRAKHQDEIFSHHAIANQIIKGQPLPNSHVVQFLRFAAFTGQSVPPEVLLYIAAVLRGDIDRRGKGRRHRPAVQGDKKRRAAREQIERYNWWVKKFRGNGSSSPALDAKKAIADEDKCDATSIDRRLTRARKTLGYRHAK